jgi:enoyl-CoA hydratase/carnithine racemase
MREELAKLAAEGELRVLIVTQSSSNAGESEGARDAGRSYFSVGADLREIASLTEENGAEFSRLGQETFALLGKAAPVTIAAIDGYCLGGGLDLALSCTLRYASPGSSFQHPGAQRGIITGWGGTQRLPRLIGVDAALRLLLLGERIDASEAQRIGLVTGIDPDPLRHAVRIGMEIADQYSREELTEIIASFETGE